MRAATVELLTIIVDFNPQIFREHLIKQYRTISESQNVKDYRTMPYSYLFILTFKDSLLISKLISHMLNDRDPEFTAANQMSQVLKVNYQLAIFSKKILISTDFVGS